MPPPALQTGESGPLSDLAGGVQWRDLRSMSRRRRRGLASKPQVTATLKGSAQDVAVADARRQGAAAGTVTISAKLGLDRDGKLTIDGARRDDGPGQREGRRQLPARRPRRPTARSRSSCPSLRAFSKLANLPLGGRGHLELTARARRRTARRSSWQGTLDQLALDGVPPGLLQESLKLSGARGVEARSCVAARQGRDGEPGFTFEMSGTGRDRAGSIDMTLKLPKLGVLQPDVGGSAEATGKVVMTPTGGDLQLTVDTDRSQPRRHCLEEARADARHRARRRRGARPAQGRRRSRQPAACARRPLRAQRRRRHPGAELQGQLGQRLCRCRRSRGDAQGRDRQRPSDFANASRILRRCSAPTLAGALDLDIATEPDDAGKVKVALRGDKLRSGTTGVRSLQLDATVDDPMGVATADATLKAERPERRGRYAAAPTPR